MAATKPKILIIDDEHDWAHSTKMLLQDKYDVDFVESGEKGIDKVRQMGYDVLLIDWQLMGEKTGTDVMVEIKQFNKVLPVILISGKIEERKPVIEAIQNGVTNYLEKIDPQISEKLPAAIEKALEGRDRVILAFEKWSRVIGDPNRVLVRTLSGKEYSAKQILEEIKKDSEFGRGIREGIVKVTLELIRRGEIKV